MPEFSTRDEAPALFRDAQQTAVNLVDKYNTNDDGYAAARVLMFAMMLVGMSFRAIREVHAGEDAINLTMSDWHDVGEQIGTLDELRVLGAFNHQPGDPKPPLT